MNSNRKAASRLNGRQPVSWRTQQPTTENLAWISKYCGNFNDFNHHFQFKKKYNGSYTLPETSKIYVSPPYEFAELQDIREQMRKVKVEICDEQFQHRWKEISEQFDTSLHLINVLKVRKLELVSVSSCKIFEILQTYPVVRTGNLNSVHISDISGFMISALNYYLHTTFSEVDWNWKAIVSNPYHEENTTTLWWVISLNLLELNF